MQKQENFLLEGHRSTSLRQKHKSAIWNRTSPHLHIKPSLYVCRKVQGSQIFKQNWIISIRSRVIVILPIWVSSALGGGAGGWGCPGWSAIVYMSSGMFRGKESSNRIELSRLVQDLLNFGVLGSLWLWGGGRWVGAWGVSPHTCTCTHAHLYMYRNCKWPPTWRHPCLACLTCMCVRACMCMRVCACMHGTPPTHPYPPPPHPPICHPPRGVDPQNHLKFDNTSTYQDISIPFEDLKSVKNSPPMGGCVVWWVGGLMGGIRSNH